MIFIIGGQKQGKTEYATTLMPEAKVMHFSDNEDIIQGNILTDIHIWVLQCLKSGLNGKEISEKITVLLPLLQNCIVVGQEIGSGIVPIDPFERILRDEVGRVYQILARNATRVYRVFAGLPIKLK